MKIIIKYKYFTSYFIQSLQILILLIQYNYTYILGYNKTKCFVNSILFDFDIHKMELFM